MLFQSSDLTVHPSADIYWYRAASGRFLPSSEHRVETPRTNFASLAPLLPRRNTELAQQKSTSKAARLAVWGPIQKSVIARRQKESDEARALAEANAASSTPAGKARTAVFELSPSEVITSAEEVVQSLDESMEIQRELGVVMEETRALIEKGKVLRERLEEIVQGTMDGDRLQVLLGLVDRLSTQLEKAIEVSRRAENDPAPIRRLTGTAPRSIQPSSTTNGASTPTRDSQQHHDYSAHPPTPLSFLPNSFLSSLQPSTPTNTRLRADPNDSITSPSFSIADSDTEEDDSDADDLSANPRQQSFNIPLPSSPAVPGFANGISGVEEELQKTPDEKEITLGVDEEEKTVESSPTTERSSKWTEEEGEVFRKGAKLVLEEEEEVSGEELKKEVSHYRFGTRLERVPSEFFLRSQLTLSLSSFLPS